ncbi:MAG: acetolactate synthase large subunit [Gammaproteobacteria bacterium]|jgi:acetolactate synthase-1/2/3 large subunit|nr:acetolactate synthase large subunit [Gammaproteobacteria bacterium]MAN68995.1 acetolactate synthase large subunit [Gammaproteobacteria bacterium]|tara:strand:+ start:1212 stop:2774 length:1563 start_codon:yes stop_codon:yes gene_type:complete
MSEVVKDRSGAESLVQTLVDSQVDVCFANPGTSEMHFVAALDTNPEMRCVLGLFEGIVTGAADGYGRMSGLPAATLTHLGPGFGNGWANLHNAKKARTPVVNVVGDHATYHRKYDAPLTSDVEGVASPVSGWVKVSQSADDVAADGAEAVEAALKPPGQVATLILPADTAWNRTAATVKPASPSSAKAYDENAVDEVASVLMGDEPCVILMNGHITSDKSELADRIAQATGARVIMDTFIPRLQRGAGRAELLRLPYFGEQAAEVLEGTRHIILCSSQPPVTFFAYPDKPNWLTPEGCALHTLVERDQDVVGALGALAEKVGADGVEANLVTLERPELPKGELNPMSIGASLANQFPEDAIVVDEGGTCGGGATMLTRTCPPHDWLMLTGGSIGYGMPCATGAAVASPDRRVICLQADGGGMYTVQALWTQARERLDVTTIIFANQKYSILQIEFGRVGAHNPGPKAMSMLDLGNPELNWVSLAEGMGVPAWRVKTAEEFNKALAESLRTPGPTLIEAMI